MSDPLNLLTGGAVGAIVTAVVQYASARLASNTSKVIQVTTATNEATDKLFKSLQTTIDQQKELIAEERVARREAEKQLGIMQKAELEARGHNIMLEAKNDRLEGIEILFRKAADGIELLRRARREGGSRWYDDGTALAALDDMLEAIENPFYPTAGTKTVPLAGKGSTVKIDPAVGGA